MFCCYFLPRKYIISLQGWLSSVNKMKFPHEVSIPSYIIIIPFNNIKNIRLMEFSFILFFLVFYIFIHVIQYMESRLLHSIKCYFFSLKEWCVTIYVFRLKKDGYESIDSLWGGSERKQIMLSPLLKWRAYKHRIH